MNVENYTRSAAGSFGGVVNQPALSEASGERPSSAVAGQNPVGGASLTVRTSPNALAAEAAGRIRPADEEDALKTDALDALVKSVLDFPPPPMPNFDIMSHDSV